MQSKKINYIDLDLIEHKKEHIFCVHNKINQDTQSSCSDKKIGTGSRMINQYDYELF